jgi:glucose-6-phosphate 1-dehydrogenase
MSNHADLRIEPSVVGLEVSGIRLQSPRSQSACNATENAYERLIGDAMKGDATLFAREDTVEEEWRIVAPILTSSEAPIEYQAGTWGPVQADRLIEGSGGWQKPHDADAKTA